AMWAGVVAAFGWRTAAVAAVFWGTNGFAGFDWTGGSFLRQGWLVTLVLGIACLRVRRPALAGALLTTSALLRVFPALVLAGLVFAAGSALLRGGSWRLPAPWRRFAGGALLALAVLVPLASWRVGPGAWPAFVANSRQLLATPLLNHMGLEVLLGFEPTRRARVLEDPGAPDPFHVWKADQRARAEARRAPFLLLAAGYVGLFALAAARTDRARAGPDWRVAALATGAIPVFTRLTAYYHAALVGLALLHRRTPAAGIALCALAAATQAIAMRVPFADVPF